jgi:hypothetical protein
MVTKQEQTDEWIVDKFHKNTDKMMTDFIGMELHKKECKQPIFVDNFNPLF